MQEDKQRPTTWVCASCSEKLTDDDDSILNLDGIPCHITDRQVSVSHWVPAICGQLSEW